jgi:ribonuclease J
LLPPFTAVLIREKFKEKHIDITNDLKIVQLNGKVKLDPFDVEYITLTHSILEPNGLRIQTPAELFYIQAIGRLTLIH